MSIYYVNIDAATDGVGSEADPFNLVASAESAAAIDGDDTIYVQGMIREQVTFDGYTGLDVLIWPGKTARIRGDRLIDTGDWSKTAGQTNVYQITLASAPASVVEDWDTNTIAAATALQIARHYGHLEPAADLVACDATASSWFHDSGVLYIHTSDSANPASNGKVYAWCAKGNGFTFDTCDSCTCNIGGELYCEFVASNGYIVRWEDCTACIHEDATLYDAGFHHVGFAGSYSIRNIMRRLVCAGQNTDESTISNAVVFAAPGDAGDLSRGNRGSDLTFHCYGLLGTDQQEFKTVVRHVPLVSHGNPLTSTTLNDLVWSDIIIVGYTDTDVQICEVRDADEPADYTSRDDYSIIISGVRTENTARNWMPPHTWIEFAYLGMREVAKDFAASYSLTNQSQTLFACEIYLNYVGQTSRFVLLNDGAKLNVVGSTIYALGDGASNENHLARIAHTGALFRSRQMVFARAASGTMFAGTSAVTAANFDCEDTWFHNVHPNNAVIGVTALNTTAEWIAAVDSTAIDNVDPELANAANNLEAAPGGALRTTKKVVAEREGDVGLNDRAYDGNYGAYQYPKLVAIRKV